MSQVPATSLGELTRCVAAYVDAEATILTVGAEAAALAEALERVRGQVIDCRAPDAMALLDYPGVQQSVETVEVNEGAEIGDVLHLALDHHARRHVLEDLCTLFGPFFLDHFAP